MTALPIPVPTVTHRGGVGTGGGAEPVLGKGERLGVVDDADRQRHGIGDGGADRDVAPASGQIRQVTSDSGCHVDIARYADTDPHDVDIRVLRQKRL